MKLFWVKNNLGQSKLACMTDTPAYYALTNNFRAKHTSLLRYKSKFTQPKFINSLNIDGKDTEVGRYLSYGGI